MKNIKYLALVLTLILMIGSLTACGANPVKDDFKDYINNNINTVFTPENNDIVKTYSDALKTQDENIFVQALKETLPTMNNALLEKLKAYTPKTTEVQELHALFISAVEIRAEGYALMLEAMTTKVSDEKASDPAIAKLGEADTKFTEFETKRTTMMKDLGLVVKK